MEFSDYAETRSAATTAVGLIIPLSQGGSAVSITEDLLNPNRGDWAGTDAFPETGGRHNSGAPMRGDRWRLINTLTIGGTDVYAPGTIIEAGIHVPGQTSANWIKYAVQS